MEKYKVEIVCIEEPRPWRRWYYGSHLKVGEQYMILLGSQTYDNIMFPLDTPWEDIGDWWSSNGVNSNDYITGFANRIIGFKRND